MSFENITLFAAFFAGLLSFISPCVLSLIPVYLGYLSGSTIVSDSPLPRRLVFSHALLFVGGFFEHLRQPAGTGLAAGKSLTWLQKSTAWSVYPPPFLLTDKE